MDGRLPEILFSGGEHPEKEMILGQPNTAEEIAPAPTARSAQKDDKNEREGEQLTDSAPLRSGSKVEGGAGNKMDGFKCPRCGKYFVSFALLKEHQLVAHVDSNSPPVTTRTRIFKYRKGDVRK